MVSVHNNEVIVDCNSISPRLLQKIKMFFTDKKQVNIDNGVLNASFSNDNDAFKFLIFLKKMNLFEFDSSATAVINQKENEKKEFEDNVSILKEVKSDESISTKDFVDFCKRCDDNMAISLRDYQYKSSYLLYKSGNGFDFSVPGAGKTIISYATYINFLLDNSIDNLFIIGPKNSYNAWFDEFQTCFNKKPDFMNLSFESIDYCRTYLGSSILNHKRINFINYDKISDLKDSICTFLSKHKNLLIIDEAHKVKNPKAQQTQAVIEISKFSNKIIELTGTPMPNGYEDLYSEYQICFPNNKVIPYSYGELKNMTKNGDAFKEKKLMDAIYPYFSRVSKKFLVARGELKEPIINYEIIKMDDSQRLIYDILGNISNDILNDWESSFALAIKKAILIRQMQASANPSLLNRAIFNSIDDFKNMMVGDIEELDKEALQQLKEKIENADKKIMEDVSKSSMAKVIIDYKNSGLMTNKNLRAAELCSQLVSESKKVIIWDTFVDNMYTISTLLLDKYNIRSEIINGSVNNADRQRIIGEFKNKDLMVLIASPATLAESISLHKACQNAIYVNRNFNAAQFIQSKDRIHRINMPEGTTANYFYLMNDLSIDLKVDKRLIEKENRMLRILDSDEIVVGSFDDIDDSSISIDDMKSVFIN